MTDSHGSLRRIASRVSLPAILISAAGLFVPFFSVEHRSFNIWQIHHGCSLVSTALAHGPTTMAMLLPSLFGSLPLTCPIMAVAWPALIVLGLLGWTAGAVVLLWRYRGVTAS